MMKSVHVHGLGASVQVDLGEDIDEREFTAAWSRCLPPPELALSPKGAEVGPRRTMTSLTQAITRELIEARAGELLMLHAGAVCNLQTGAAMAYVAPGGTGKTTLTAVLGREFGYLTDETVGVDPRTDLIAPYPKPLSQRTPEGGYPKVERGPDALGLLQTPSQAHLASLVLLVRDAAQVRPRWTRLSLFDAVLRLAPESSSLARLNRPLHVLSDLYARLDGFWLVEYSEASHLVDGVAQRLEGA